MRQLVTRGRDAILHHKFLATGVILHPGRSICKQYDHVCVTSIASDTRNRHELAINIGTTTKPERDERRALFFPLLPQGGNVASSK